MHTSKLLNSFLATVLLSGAAMTAVQAAEPVSKMALPAQIGVKANATVSDEVITSSAKSALSADAQLSALPISLTTKKGVVVLSGDIPSAAVGDKILQIIASVEGVKDVKNELKVKAAG